MAKTQSSEVVEVLNGFAEVMSRLMVDQYQQQTAELDLTLPQAHVLRILLQHPMTTGQLALELKCSAPAVTQLTDRLIRKELIERRPAADDRRCVIVALSAKGSRLLERFKRRRAEIFDEALADLSDSDRAHVIDVFGRVVKALETYGSRNGASSNGNGTAMAAEPAGRTRRPADPPRNGRSHGVL